MSEPITINGTILPDGSLRLHSSVGMPPGPVEVTVRPVPESKREETGLEVLLRFRAEDEASGSAPGRTAEEIDAYLNELREEWEDRYRELEAMQQECHRQAETPPQSKEP